MKRRSLLGTLGAVPIACATDRIKPLTDEGYPYGSYYRSDIVAGTPTTTDGFFQAFQAKNDMVWSGGDQVASFKHNGYIYWLFGDTMLSNGENPDGSYPAGWQMVGNRILLQQGDQFINAMADGGLGIPNPTTRTDANNERYWAQGMFYANGSLWVLCQRVKNDPTPGSIGFKLVGSELAKYSVDGVTGKLTLKSMIVTPGTGQEDVPGTKGIQWCNDALLSGTYVYIYGSTRSEGNQNYVIHFSYVARVPTASLENPATWTFYKKSTNTWVSKISDLSGDVALQPDAMIEGQLNSIKWIGNQHVAVQKPWNNWGDKVMYQTSPTPWGAWSTSQLVFDSPAGTWEGREYETYCPQLHPEQVLASGKTLISIAWNGKTFNDVLANADLGKPRFHEFTF